MAELADSLKRWLGGKYPIPQLYTFNDGGPLPINITVSEKGLANNESINSSSAYQGVFLGYEIIDLRLIGYFGLKDHAGVPYYIAVNDGDITNPKAVLAVNTGISSAYSMLGQYHFLYRYSDGNTYTFLNNNIGAGELFNFQHSYPIGAITDPALLAMLTEINGQADFSKAFNHFSEYPAWTGRYTNAPTYSQFTSLISHRVTSGFDTGKVPFLNSIYKR